MVLGLSRIGDLRQRSYALASRLKRQPTDCVLDIIKVIREEALKGHGDFRLLYNGLLVSGMLGNVFGPARMSLLVEAAQERGDFDLVALLMDLPAEAAHDIPHQPFLDGSLKETPLGMRKALARKPDFRLIQRIARDQDHRVIQQLLDNPRLTEKDVVRIAATRPTSPRVLEEIYGHRRWITRYSVKKTIVFNPHAPLSLSMRLVAYLTVQDLEQLVERDDVNQELLEQAHRILKQKTRFLLKENLVE